MEWMFSSVAKHTILHRIAVHRHRSRCPLNALNTVEPEMMEKLQAHTLHMSPVSQEAIMRLPRLVARLI